MKKYSTVFRLSWQSVLEYRFNFVMGRVRDSLFLLTVYFLWTAAFKGRATLFGFESHQIITYILGASLISVFVFDYAMDRIAEGISQGELSVFLTRPINFVVYHQVRRLASTVLGIILMAGELGLFLILVKPRFFLQGSLTSITLSIFSLILALMIFIMIDSIAGVSSFWTLHAYGPRFALKMFIDLTSGRIFPLSLLPMILFRVTALLPFSYLVFFPLNVYLGRLNSSQVIFGMLIQIFWFFLLSAFLKLVWKRGLKIYEAVGI